MGLLEIRDELAAVRDFVGCLYLACQHVQVHDERSALSAVSYEVRERLRTIDAALANIINGDTHAV